MLTLLAFNLGAVLCGLLLLTTYPNRFMLVWDAINYVSAICVAVRLMHKGKM